MTTSSRRIAAISLLLALLTAACSEAQETSSDSVEGACSLTGLKAGLPLLQDSGLVVATVRDVGKPRLEGEGRSQTVYTPVTLENVEALHGPAPTEVFFRGGTADGHTTTGVDYLGLVPGGNVLVSIGMDPSLLGGPVADPPGPYVETTFPIDAQGKVLLSGCWYADDVPGSASVRANTMKLDPQGRPEKVSVDGHVVPLAAVRALVRTTLR